MEALAPAGRGSWRSVGPVDVAVRKDKDYWLEAKCLKRYCAWPDLGVSGRVSGRSGRTKTIGEAKCLNTCFAEDIWLEEA